jgi:Mg2+ and Co2+ transporter CorA
LDWQLGYPISILMMVGFSGAVMLYFRRKKWL